MPSFRTISTTVVPDSAVPQRERNLLLNKLLLCLSKKHPFLVMLKGQMTCPLKRRHFQ